MQSPPPAAPAAATNKKARGSNGQPSLLGSPPRIGGAPSKPQQPQQQQGVKYAGFESSPAPDSLPVPKFAQLQPQPQPQASAVEQTNQLRRLLNIPVS